MIRIWGVLLLACLFACRQHDTPTKPGWPLMVRDANGERMLFFGPRTTATIGRATNVHAYQIVSYVDPVEKFEEMKRNHPLIDDYPIIQEADVSPAAAARTAAILLDPKIYRSDSPDCSWVPGYVLKFRRGKESVDVVICFKCQELAISSSLNTPERAPMTFFRSKQLHDAVLKVFSESKRSKA